jgi:hypothetical protein
VKKIWRSGHSFTGFEHYRLRVLLEVGGVTLARVPATTEAHDSLSPLQRAGPEMWFSIGRDAGSRVRFGAVMVSVENWHQ